MSQSNKNESNSNQNSSPQANVKKWLCLGIVGGGLLLISYHLLKSLNWNTQESLPNTQHNTQQKQRAPMANDPDSSARDVSSASGISTVSAPNSNSNISNPNPLIAMSLYANKNNIFKEKLRLNHTSMMVV